MTLTDTQIRRILDATRMTPRDRRALLRQVERRQMGARFAVYALGVRHGLIRQHADGSAEWVA